MSTRFVPNPAFKSQIQAEAPFGTGMRKITVGVAESITVAAEPFRDSGNYIGRVGVRGTTVELEKHFAHIMEFGSVNNPPQRNALRGVRAAGLRFEDDRAALT
jgi:hypothetical protein